MSGWPKGRRSLILPHRRTRRTPNAVPQGLVIKFKEQTDTALMADLVPPTEVPAAAAGVEGGVAEGGTVAPGSAALKA